MFQSTFTHTFCVLLVSGVVKGGGEELQQHNQSLVLLLKSEAVNYIVRRFLRRRQFVEMVVGGWKCGGGARVKDQAVKVIRFNDTDKIINGRIFYH